MRSIDLTSTFKNSVVMRVAGGALALVLAGCTTVPERQLDSCMKRGAAANYFGLVAKQDPDEFNKDCDEGRDLAIIAATKAPNGAPDPVASLTAGATVMSKREEIRRNYEAQLKLRGLTPQQVTEAANRLIAEAETGAQKCETRPGYGETLFCKYVLPPAPAASAASAPAPSAAK